MQSFVARLSDVADFIFMALGRIAELFTSNPILMSILAIFVIKKASDILKIFMGK
jgi:hypothetical protein